jgi:hypothetical protein
MNSSLLFQRISRLTGSHTGCQTGSLPVGQTAGLSVGLSLGLPLLLLSLAAAFPAQASEPKEAVVAKASPSDPMTHLKERLQEKLGALRAQESASGGNELKVPTRAPATAPARAARADGDAANLARARGTRRRCINGH